MCKISRATCSFLIWALSLLPVLAQELSVQGTVYDQSTRNPLSQVTVNVTNSPQTFVTEQDGKFVITGLSTGNYSLEFNTAGYDVKIVEVVLEDRNLDVGIVELFPRQRQALSELVVSDLELDMETDIQDIAPLLTSSQDVFNDVAAYNLSSVRFRQRGYEGKYSDVYLNGLQMNDMNTGNVIWAVWGGLNDAVRNQENYLGLETGNYAFGNIGGVQNIITRASAYRPQTRLTYSYSNRTYANRAMFTYATGMQSNGWAFTVSGSRRWGDRGYVKGTFYDAWSYFLAIEKKINDSHSLALTTLGAPTERGVTNGSTQEVYDLVGHNYYNSNVGVYNGKWRNARVRDNHEPVILLNHYWNVTDATRLTTSVGYRFGYNGYSALNWYDADDPRPDYYRYLPSFYDNDGKLDQGNEIREMWYSDPSTRYINWAELYNVNYKSDNYKYTINGQNVPGKRSKYIIEDRRNDQKQLSAAILLNTKLSSTVNLNGGLNFRNNKTAYFKTVKDLLGGDYWYDIDQFAERDFTDPILVQSDLNNPYRIVKEGDTFGYNYDANINEIKLWATSDAHFYKFDIYGGFEVGNSSFYRNGNYKKGLYPENSYGDSEKKSFLEFGLKGGATYKLSGRHYFTANAAYFQNAPYFNESFISPRTRNTIIANMETEKILSGDLNYYIRTPLVKGRFTAYYTQINDQTSILNFYDDVYRSFGNYMMTGIDREHMGIETGIEVKLTPTITAEGMFGYGQHKYVSNPDYVQTVDNTEAFLDADKVYWENFNVEGSPMTVGSIGLSYNSPNYWWIGLSGNYFDRAYIDMNPSRRTDRARAELSEEYIKQEKFDAGFTLDAFAGISYRINYKYFLGVSLSASNLLNKRDIRSGGYEQLRVNIDRDTGRMLRPFDSRYFYMYGTNFFLNVNFRF